MSPSRIHTRLRALGWACGLNGSTSGASFLHVAWLVFQGEPGFEVVTSSLFSMLSNVAANDTSSLSPRTSESCRKCFIHKLQPAQFQLLLQHGSFRCRTKYPLLSMFGWDLAKYSQPRGQMSPCHVFLPVSRRSLGCELVFLPRPRVHGLQSGNTSNIARAVRMHGDSADSFRLSHLDVVRTKFSKDCLQGAVCNPSNSTLVVETCLQVALLLSGLALKLGTFCKTA